MTEKKKKALTALRELNAKCMQRKMPVSNPDAQPCKVLSHRSCGRQGWSSGLKKMEVKKAVLRLLFLVYYRAKQQSFPSPG